MCKIQNLRDNPFARFSAEEEEDLRSIYLKPRYYDALKSNAKQGNSRILVGQRGLGKSATIHMLFEDLSKNKTLPVLISRYDGIPLTDNKSYFLCKMIQSLTKEITKRLCEDKKKLKKLNKGQRGKLSFLIELFYDQEFADDYLAQAKVIRTKKRMNWFKILFNNNLKLVNSIVDGVVKITSSVIRQSIGLSESDLSYGSSNDYFTEIPLSRINSMPISDIARMGDEKLVNMLKTTVDISVGLGFDSIVVLFDKIDEFSAVNSDINKVADFTIPILSDTDLLYTNKLSVVFSLWSEVKRTLNSRGVRFDKFPDIDISWRGNELEQLIDKRLLFYSKDKNNPVTLKGLVPFENDRKTILELADGSPRALITILGRIYDEETITNNSNSFSANAISKGLVEFCIRFDYESLHPSKITDKKNYYSWLNKALAIKKPSFTIPELSGIFQIKQQTAVKYVSDMTKYRIVDSSEFQDGSGNQVYDILDPRIKHLMKCGVSNLGK